MIADPGSRIAARAAAAYSRCRLELALGGSRPLPPAMSRICRSVRQRMTAARASIAG